MLNPDSFYHKVYHIARVIPYGRVTTYSAIAERIGSKGSARMVGWAMNKSHIYPEIPAHRVVNSKGLLTGKHHFGGSNIMQQLLESEGIEIAENKVVRFEELFWKPEL